MNKQGKVYVNILCGFMIIMLIASYLVLSKTYKKYEELQVTKDIGGKQGAILLAVREGERVQMYVQQAALLAAREASRQVTCGGEYLNRRIIGTGTCEGDASVYLRVLNEYLSAYPGGSLTDITWNQTSGTTLEGIKRIPVGTREEPAATFEGAYTGWPTNERRVTSLFGNRNVQGGSRNHPGIDIATNGRAGEPVFALKSGEARYYDLGENSYVRVTSDNIIIDYMHINAAPEIPTGNSVAVEERQLIGTTLAFYGGAQQPRPHLHLQVLLPDVSAETIRNLGWATNNEHAGNSDTQTTEQSYAVISGNKAYLNPVCFFDRAKITEILQASNGITITPQTFEACDAYEQAWRLSERFQRPALAEGEANFTNVSRQATQTAQPTSITPRASYPEVRQTKERLDQQQLLGKIYESAERENVEPAHLLAIITQESKGDPDAISTTGAAGIAQFTSATAKAYFEPADKNLILSCCPIGSPADLCRDPARNSCNEQTDPRFNPHKSIDAQAKYVKFLLNRYTQYEHGVLFGLTAYNAGEGNMDNFVRATSKQQPTWDEVKLAITRSDISEARKTEIKNYGDKIAKWYEAWGGHTFAGTSFTSEHLGWYDLRLAINSVVPTTFNDIIASMHTQLQDDASAEQVERTIMGFNKDGIVVQPEMLDSAEGCLTPEERAQAYAANQLQRCKFSLGTACSCPFESSIDVELRLTPASLHVTKINGERVTGGQDFPGLVYNAEADSETERVIQLFTGGLGLEQGTTEANLKLSATQKVVELIRNNAIDVDREFASLYKAPEQLAFTRDEVQACVPYPLPKAYCMYNQDNPQDKVVFYVDMAAHSNPAADPSNTPTQGVVQRSEELKKLTWRAPPFPYAHITVILTNSTITQHYLTIYDLGQLTREQLDIDAAAGNYKVIRSADEYETILPLQPGDSITIQLMDDNLRETQPVLVQVPTQ